MKFRAPPNHQLFTISLNYPSQCIILFWWNASYSGTILTNNMWNCNEKHWYLKRRNFIIPRCTACQPSVRILHRLFQPSSVILQFKCNTHNNDNSKLKTCNLLQHLKLSSTWSQRSCIGRKMIDLSNYSKPSPNCWHISHTQKALILFKIWNSKNLKIQKMFQNCSKFSRFLTTYKWVIIYMMYEEKL
jgi:hypothetical protein